jgi:putative hydrolase of the HAD superfamily
MTEITTIFCDVGGVLGTDGWDHLSRRRAVEHFKLELSAFEAAHAKHAAAFDTGFLTADQYMQEVVFTEPRHFAKGDFLQFMKNESIVFPESVQVISRLAACGDYFMATINNESVELNQFRIEKFGLKPLFSAFFCSGYLGIRKPDIEIFQRALLISNKEPGETVFIDDRQGNLVNAEKLGMHTVQFETAAQLVKELQALGVQIPAQAPSVA